MPKCRNNAMLNLCELWPNPPLLILASIYRLWGNSRCQHLWAEIQHQVANPSGRWHEWDLASVWHGETSEVSASCCSCRFFLAVFLHHQRSSSLSRRSSTPTGWPRVAWPPKGRPWPTARTTWRSRTFCPSSRCSTWTLTLSSLSQSPPISTQNAWCPRAIWRSTKTSRYVSGRQALHAAQGCGR